MPARDETRNAEPLSATFLPNRQFDLKGTRREKDFCGGTELQDGAGRGARTAGGAAIQAALLRVPAANRRWALRSRFGFHVQPGGNLRRGGKSSVVGRGPF